MRRDERLLTAPIIYSAIFHGIVGIISVADIFHFYNRDQMFVDVEIAGAAEMNQDIADYDNNQKIADDIPNVQEEIQPQEIEQTSIEPVVDEPHEVENSEPEPEPIANDVVQDSEYEEPQEIAEDTNVDEDQINIDEQEEALRLAEEKKKAEEEAKKAEEDRKRKEKERRKAEEKAKKDREEKARREALKKKREQEALKKLELKKKSKKKRLAQIAAASKKAADKKKADDAFDKMLAKEKKQISQPQKNKNNASSKFLRGVSGNGLGRGNGLGSFGDGRGFVQSDAAIISSQVIPHWVVPGGVKNAESLIIKIRIKLKDNGEVIPSSIEILDMNRYNSDMVFRSAADSAKRAILEASPFKIPANKMHLFRDFEFSFNTDKALGG